MPKNGGEQGLIQKHLTGGNTMLPPDNTPTLDEIGISKINSPTYSRLIQKRGETYQKENDMRTRTKKFRNFDFERDLVNKMLRENLSVSAATADEICVPLEPHVLSDVEVRIYWQCLADQVTAYYTDQKENEKWLPRIQELWDKVKDYPQPEGATYPICLARVAPVVTKESWLSDVAMLVRDLLHSANAQNADTRKVTE